MTATIFLPFFVSAFAVGLYALYCLFSPKRRAAVLGVPRVAFLAAWAGLTVVTGLLYRNFYGIAPALLFFLFVVFALYVCTVASQSLLVRVAQLSAAAITADFLGAWVQKIVLVTSGKANGAFFSAYARTPSAFYNPNYYGFMCEIVLLVCLYALLQLRTNRILYSAGILSCFGGILLSDCHSAWFAAFGGALVLLLALRRYRPFFIGLGATLAFGMIILLFPGIVPRAASFGSSASLRVSIWKTALEAFLRHPLFGEGFLSYYHVTLGAGAVHRAHAHNLALEALVSFGVAGTALALLFLLPAVVSWAKRAKRCPECALALGALAAVVIHGITDVPVLGYQTGSYVMVILALTGLSGAGRVRAPGRGS